MRRMHRAHLTLGDEQLAASFDKAANLGIYSIRSEAAGIELRRSKATPCTLFRLTMKEAGRVHVLTNLDAREVRFHVRPRGRVAKFWFGQIGGRELAAVVRVSIPEDGASYWSIKVRNDTDAIIAAVGFPWITGYAGLTPDPSVDSLAYPLRDGLLLDNPGKRVLRGWKVPESGLYPGTISMQFMAVYGDDKGFYIACDDIEGEVKRFCFEAEKGRVAIGVDHMRPEVPGEDFCPRYGVRISGFSGDWRDSAQIYRSWARRQWWCALDARSRRDIPGWVRLPHPILSIENYATTGGTSKKDLRFKLADLPRKAAEYGRALGTPLISFWTGWEKSGAWVSPDLFPPVEGEAKFAKAARKAHADGGHLEAYFSTTLWIRKSGRDERNFLKEGLPSAIMREDGGRNLGEAWLGRTAAMCPATSVWQQKIEEAMRACVSHGFDLVQLDMFPIMTPSACYDASHPHAPGYGRWFFEACKQLVSRARASGRMLNPELAMSAEHMCELYLPQFDTYLSRDESRNKEAPWPRKENLAIPLFGFVYHDYLPTQALEWNMIYLDHFVHDIALQLARGKRLAFFEGFGSLDAKWRPPAEPRRRANKRRGLKFLRAAVATARSQAGQAFLMGEMLKPPDAYVTREGGAARPISWDSTEPSIGTFRHPDGRYVVVLANAATDAREVAISWGTGQIPSGRHERAILLNGVSVAPPTIVSLKGKERFVVGSLDVLCLIVGRLRAAPPLPERRSGGLIVHARARIG